MEATEQQAVLAKQAVEPVALQVAPQSEEKKEQQDDGGAQPSINPVVLPVSATALGREDETLEGSSFLRKKEGDGPAQETGVGSSDGNKSKEEQTTPTPPEGLKPAHVNIASTNGSEEQEADGVKEEPDAGDEEGISPQADGTDSNAQKKVSNKGSSSKPRRSRKGSTRRSALPRPYVSPIVEPHTHALPIFVPGPSPLDVAYPRKSRSSKPARRPRSSRAAINRLKQAAHGALPLGASLAAAALGGTGGRTGRGAAEDESEPDSGEEVEEFESSEYDSEDSDAETRRSKKARHEAEEEQAEEEERRRHAPAVLRGGVYQGYALQHQQYNRAYPSEAEHRRQTLLHQLSNAPPHIRHQLLAQLRQQQQQGGSSWGPGSPRAGAFEYQGGATQSGSPMAPGFDPGMVPLHALPPDAQQAAMQSILSRMTPQERHQLGSLGLAQQHAAFEELHRRHLLAARLATQQQPTPYQMGPVQPPIMMHAGTSSPTTTGGGNGYHGSPGSPMAGAGHNPSQVLDPQRAARLQAFLSTLPPSVKARVAELPREQQAAALVRLLQLQQQQQRAAQQQQAGSQPFSN